MKEVAKRTAIVLLQPLIHWNTGAIGRTSIGFGCELHLIKPLGFSLDSKEVKRAGLDYWHDVDLRVHENWDEFASRELKNFSFKLLLSKRAKLGSQCFYDVRFPDNENVALIFGNEDAGVPSDLVPKFADIPGSYVPMSPKIRAFNLSNTVALAVNELMRQRHIALREVTPIG